MQAGVLCGYSISRIVADAVHETVLRARRGIGTGRCVGPRSPVAASKLGVLGLIDRVGARVEDDGGVLLLASARLGALPGGDLGMVVSAFSQALRSHQASEEAGNQPLSTHGRQWSDVGRERV